MKAKWLLLTKLQLWELSGLNKLRHSSDGRQRRRMIGVTAAIGLIGLFLLAFTAFLCVLLAEKGMGARVPAFMLTIASFLVFLYTLVRGGGGLFAVRDYEKILSLPVKKRDLIVSRLFGEYLPNLVFTLLFLLPALVVYHIYCGFDIGMFGAIILATLCAPLAPLAVALTLGTLLSALTAGFRYRALLRAVLGILLFGALMTAYFFFTLSANTDLGANLAGIADALIGKAYPPALLLDKTLTGAAVWGVFAFAGGSLLLAAVFCLIVACCYKRIHASLQARSTRVAYNAAQVKRSPVFAALLKIEFKRLLGSSAYLFNSLGGLIVTVVLVVVLLFGFDDPAAFPPWMLANVPYALAGLAAAMVGTACPAASALSLEGNARGQLFALPVSARKILLAKAAPTFLLDGAVMVCASVLYCILAGAGWEAYLICPFSALAAAAFVALAGIYLNYKHPKYDWTQEIQVYKRGTPVMILSFGCLLPGIAATVLALLFGWLPVVILTALYILLGAMILLWMRKATLYV